MHCSWLLLWPAAVSDDPACALVVAHRRCQLNDDRRAQCNSASVCIEIHLGAIGGEVFAILARATALMDASCTNSFNYKYWFAGLLAPC